MNLRYRQAHERFACTEPTSHRFDVAVDADEPSIIKIPDITLATDRPVRQWVMGLGIVQLRLRLQKRASISRWQKSGRVQPDGSLTMLGDHGSGSFWEPNSARDNIGRWHNLRIETRGEGEDEHLALVADAKVHEDLAANWISRNVPFRPSAVASVFRSGTIRDTSIGFEFNHNTLKLEDEDRQLYRTDDWTPHEASFVWEGADDTGIGRAAEDDMSKELLEQLLAGQKTISDEQAALGVRIATLEVKPETTPTPEPEAVPALGEEQQRWDGLAALWKREGDDIGIEKEILELDPQRCEKLSTILMDARVEKQPPPARSATGGNPGHFDLMKHAQIAMLHRHPATKHLVEKDIDEVPQSIRTAPLHVFLEMSMRHSGVLDNHITFRDHAEIFEHFKDNHTVPKQAVHNKALGGHWLANKGAKYNHNGVLDVEASLRSAAGTVTASSFPALLVSITFKAFDGTYQSAGISIDDWSRRNDLDTLDERNIIRADVAVPSFDKLARAGQDLPAAARWHDELTFQVAERGFIYSWAEEVMLRDNGIFLVNTPVLLSDAWVGERDRFFVNIIINHDYGTLGQDFNREQAIIDFLDHAFTSAFRQTIVERPDEIDIKLSSRVNNGQLLPTKLIHGPALETEMSSFFDGRLNETGRLPADTSDLPNLPGFMRTIGRSREMTPLIPTTGPNARRMYLFVAGGTWSSLIHGSLRGRQGPRVTIVNDTNWKRLPETGMRVTEAFGGREWQPNTMYQNDVP